jgi:endoglycosylceramidase
MIKIIKSVKSQIIFIISLIYLIQLNQCNLLNQRSDQKKNALLGKIRIKDKWFIDPDNRVVLFHGINAVEKNFPWLPTQARANLTNRTQLDNLKRWGMNVVRLGFMWSGLYPEKGVVNQSYVNEMVKIVQTLEEHGIWVIIDLHQDMLSSQFAAYDGAPAWILEQLPPPKHKYPWPFKNEYLGFGAYVTEACGFAFQCLYKNINNFERYFHDYWTTVAQIFNSTSSVLGYELINEPWVYNNNDLFCLISD